jgi:hypothetical protein
MAVFLVAYCICQTSCHNTINVNGSNVHLLQYIKTEMSISGEWYIILEYS